MTNSYLIMHTTGEIQHLFAKRGLNGFTGERRLLIRQIL